MKPIIHITLILLLLTGCAGPSSKKGEKPGRPDGKHPAEEITLPKDSRKDLGRQFLELASRGFDFVKDPDVVSLVNSLGREIVRAAGSDPDYYHFFVVRQNQINAFAVPGGYIFLYDGLIKNMDGINELAGVLAHEIAHVERDHHFKDSKKIALANLATLAGIIIGANQGGDNADAPAAAALSANIAYQLKLSRVHEEEADLFAIRYLKEGGHHPVGLLSFFKKLSHQERLNSAEDIPGYLSTHPGVIERQVIVEALTRDMPVQEDSDTLDTEAWDRMITLLKAENRDGLELPEDDISPEKRHYLKGLYAFRSNDYKRAIAEYNEAIRLGPSNPIYHSDMAMLYLRSQDMERAKEAAMKSLNLSKEHAAPFVVLGFAAKKKGDNKEAADYLSEATKLSPLDPFIHYHLAGVYHALGQPARGWYHMGQHFRFNLESKKAITQFMTALQEVKDETLVQEIKEALRDIKRDGI